LNVAITATRPTHLSVLPELADTPAQLTAANALTSSLEGFAIFIGPLLAGAAIDILSNSLDDTRGYQALWPILAVPVLLAIPLVWQLSAAERDAGAGQPESPESIT